MAAAPWTRTSREKRSFERCSSMVKGNRTARARGDQILLNATVALVPPKPNEFEIAASIFI